MPDRSVNREHAPATSIVLVRDLRKTAGLVAAWEELAAHALEPNVFYEHWMLLPALRAWGAAAGVRVALVWHARDPGAPATLAGLMPLSFVTHGGRLKLSAARLWQQPHCDSSAPLIRDDCAVECVGALLEWLRQLPWAHLLEIPSLRDDGPVHELLLDCSQGLRLRTWSRSRGHRRSTRQGLTVAVSRRGEFALAAHRLARWTSRWLLRRPPSGIRTDARA